MNIQCLLMKHSMEMYKMSILDLPTNELKVMLKQFKGVSMGVRDLMLKHAIEDELARRKNNV
jgi:hypothetical protein